MRLSWRVSQKMKLRYELFLRKAYIYNLFIDMVGGKRGFLKKRLSAKD